MLIKLIVIIKCVYTSGTIMLFRKLVALIKDQLVHIQELEIIRIWWLRRSIII